MLAITPTPTVTPELRLSFSPMTPLSGHQSSPHESTCSPLIHNRDLDSPIYLENYDINQDYFDSSVPCQAPNSDSALEIANMKLIYRQVNDNENYIAAPVYIGSSEYSPSLCPADFNSPPKSEIPPFSLSSMESKKKNFSIYKSRSYHPNSISSLNYNPFNQGMKTMTEEYKIHSDFENSKIRPLSNGFVFEPQSNRYSKYQYYYDETITLYCQEISILLHTSHFKVHLFPPKWIHRLHWTVWDCYTP